MAMKRVGVAELKDQLSKYLREVESGAEVEVTDRDRPLARIVPAKTAREVAIVPARRPFASVRRRRYPLARWATPSVDVLLEERQGR
jgi:prevent-host-death family protein